MKSKSMSYKNLYQNGNNNKAGANVTDIVGNGRRRAQSITVVILVDFFVVDFLIFFPKGIKSTIVMFRLEGIIASHSLRLKFKRIYGISQHAKEID
jgi:hypothetical protein